MHDVVAVERFVERASRDHGALCAFRTFAPRCLCRQCVQCGRPLNPRVRGSSPWRRTRPDLELYPRRLPMLIVRGARLGPSWGPSRGPLPPALAGAFRVRLPARQARSIQTGPAYHADRSCDRCFRLAPLASAVNGCGPCGAWLCGCACRCLSRAGAAAAARAADLPGRVRPRPPPRYRLPASPALRTPVLVPAAAPGAGNQASGPDDQRSDLLRGRGRDLGQDR